MGSSYEVACRKRFPRAVGAFRRRPGRFSWRTLPAPPHPLGGNFLLGREVASGFIVVRGCVPQIFFPGRAVRFDEISSQTKRVRSELSTRQRSVPSHRARPRGVSSAPHEEGTDPARRSPAAPPSAPRFFGSTCQVLLSPILIQRSRKALPLLFKRKSACMRSS